MTSPKQSTRSLVSYIPVVTALVGVTVVVSGVVFFFAESDIRRLMAVTVGLGILILSVWYAANPFIRSSRRFKNLRREVEGFINLVQVLNVQAVAEAAPEDMARTTARMHEAVDRMAAQADKTG